MEKVSLGEVSKTPDSDLHLPASASFLGGGRVRCHCQGLGTSVGLSQAIGVLGGPLQMPAESLVHDRLGVQN